MTYIESVRLGLSIAAELRAAHNNGHPVFVFADDQRRFMIEAGYRGEVIVLDSTEASTLAAIFRSQDPVQQQALYDGLIYAAKHRAAAKVQTKLTSGET